LFVGDLGVVDCFIVERQTRISAVAPCEVVSNKTTLEQKREAAL
jgi:hypothetical protein